MKFPINPLRQWVLCLGCMFLGWYSSHLIPVDSDLNYMELRMANILNEESIQLLATCASIESENTSLIHEINDLTTGKIRKTSLKNTSAKIGEPTPDASLAHDANEIRLGINCIGIGLAFQREALKYILKELSKDTP